MTEWYTFHLSGMNDSENPAITNGFGLRFAMSLVISCTNIISILQYNLNEFFLKIDIGLIQY